MLLRICCLLVLVLSSLLSQPIPCSIDSLDSCVIDTFIGSNILYEDSNVRIWNLTLAPGEMTSMHRHDCDYHFVCIIPSTLEVWDIMGNKVMTFKAEGTLGLTPNGDNMVQIGDNVKNPITFTRTHAAKNVGETTFYEILYESKTKCVVPVPIKNEL